MKHIVSKDIATGKGAEGFGETIMNLKNEVTAEGEGNEEKDRMSRETPRRSMDSRFIDTTTSSKRRKKYTGPRKETGPSDPFLVMLRDVNTQLNGVMQHVGAMATAMERKATVHEKIMLDDPQQKFKEKAIGELVKLSFIGSEIVDAARIFAQSAEQMHMMIALPENLRREFILKILSDEKN